MAENITETARLLVVEPGIGRSSPTLVCGGASNSMAGGKLPWSAWDAIERLQSGATPNLLLLDLPRGDDDCMRILRWMATASVPTSPSLWMCSPEDAGRKKEAITCLGAQEVLLRSCLTNLASKGSHPTPPRPWVKPKRMPTERAH